MLINHGWIFQMNIACIVLINYALILQLNIACFWRRTLTGFAEEYCLQTAGEDYMQPSLGGYGGVVVY